MKNELRKYALEKRKKLDINKLSGIILKKLFSMKEYKNSKKVICYYPLNYEVDIRKCIYDSSKTIYLPRIHDYSLEICYCDKLKKGKFGIIEPQTSKETDYSLFDIIIIPSCAVDVNGFRLGWGKGFYDRFLPLLPPSCKKIVPIFSDLLFETVYPNEFDIKADIIVSDKEILRL